MGLRERKKIQTRQAMLKSAYELFEQKGYNQTSIEEIASRANFAPRTFFLHFTSKEDLLFPQSEELLQRLVETFENRGKTSAVEAFKQWQAEEMTPMLLENKQKEALRRRLIPESRQLQARVQYYVDETRRLLAAEIAKDRGLSSVDLTSNIVATAVVSTFSNIYDNGMQQLSQHEITKSIREALEVLGAVPSV